MRSTAVSFDLNSTQEYEFRPLTDIVPHTDIWYDVEEFKRMRSDEKEMAQLMGWGYIQTTKDSSASSSSSTSLPSHQRGLEHTISSLKKARRKNIIESQRVVMKHQNLKNCNPKKLAKLYHSKVKKCTKDAYQVGLSDAKAIGIDLTTSTTNEYPGGARENAIANGNDNPRGILRSLVRLKRRAST